MLTFKQFIKEHYGFEPAEDDPLRLHGTSVHRSGPHNASVEFNHEGGGRVAVDFGINSKYHGSNPDVPAEHKIKLLRGMRNSFREYVATNRKYGDLRSVQLHASPFDSDPDKKKKAVQYQRIAQQTADATGGTVEHHPLGSTVHWASK